MSEPRLLKHRRILNRQASVAPVIPTGFSTPVAETLPAVALRIAQTLRPDKIILFGSYAYGRPTADSDVDLLVVMNTRLRPRQQRLVISRALSPHPFPMDILVKTPQ